VTPQTLLTTIDQNDTLEVNASVPIERAAVLKVGLPLQVWSSDGAQRIATTSVSFISPHADDQTQSLLVKGNVKNPHGTLRAAQYVRARIVWKTADGLVVPVTAVLRVNGQFFAFVAEPAGGALVAKQRPIKVGPIAGDSYPVVEGLKPGDRVVVSGAQKLADGAPIQDTPDAAGSKPPASGSSPPAQP
jgi:RND family efflux transporter MFP subunit